MATDLTKTRRSSSQGLAFLALAGFVASFVAARTFTTVNPNAVVVSSGIHFHHFWYGLVTICIAGWLGIASTRPEFDRIYALSFGLGLGLIGDETGLLLTLGDYHSELTYVVVLMGLSAAAMIYLAFRDAPAIEKDVLRLGRGERVAHFGVAVMAVSSLAFAFDYYATGGAVLALGLAVTIIGAWTHRTYRSRN